MKQIISLHIGQAGVQVGSPSWQLLAAEHQISLEGKAQTSSSDQSTQAFFCETQTGQYVSRAVCTDLDSIVIDQVRKGSLRHLHSPSNMISGKEDAANNYIRGHYTIGKNILDSVLDIIRKETEKCEQLQGFFLQKSLGGGTGSGLGDLILERLSIDYHKKSNIGFNIHPSPNLSSSPVEPYNALLSMHTLLEHESISILFDNEALYKICSRSLNIDNPNYLNINQLIARIVSSMAAPISFGGVLNTDLADLSTNLIPYPRIHFITPSYAPFMDHNIYCQPQVQDLTQGVFNPSNLMISCDSRVGKYMSCSLLYRGEIVHKDVCCALSSLRNKNNIQFVDWCPTGFKVGINSKPPAKNGETIGKSPTDCTLLSNSSSIQQSFDRVCLGFDRLYSKRAFLHWYVGQGLDEGLFGECREDLAALQKDYEQVVSLSQ